MRQEGMNKEDVARQSGHKAAHVLALLADPSPNPSLRLYLDLLDAAGARFVGVEENTTRAVVEHFAAVMEERDISTSKLARLADVNRAQLSTLLNDPDPNPKLAVIDRIVEALEIEDEFGLVSAAASEDAVDDEVDEDEEEAVDDEEADEGDEGEEDEVEEDEVDEEEDEVDDDQGEGEEDEDEEAVDEEEDEVDEDEDEVDNDEDQVAADDMAAEQAEQIRALQQQNAALQRQVQQNQAELSELKGKKSWWRTAFEVATGAVAIGGAAYLVTRPPPKK